jgi:hypothetical protein
MTTSATGFGRSRRRASKQAPPRSADATDAESYSAADLLAGHAFSDSAPPAAAMTADRGLSSVRPPGLPNASSGLAVFTPGSIRRRLPAPLRGSSDRPLATSGGRRAGGRCLGSPAFRVLSRAPRAAGPHPSRAGGPAISVLRPRAPTGSSTLIPLSRQSFGGSTLVGKLCAARPARVPHPATGFSFRFLPSTC